jgi:exosortase A-associated hydrolase 1
MSAINEQALLFGCEGDELVGIVTQPMQQMARIGVLVVVGGPQYRVGSHRQFVLLARQLAEHGVACMRFDYRGMGDACGEQRSFEDAGRDIEAALNGFLQAVPELRGVVLWGLCDGATAAAFYAHSDPRVRGLILLNPWVKTEAGEAKAYLKHYYLKRLCSVSFWKKLLGGGVALSSSLYDLSDKLNKIREKKLPSQAEETLPERMFAALYAAKLPIRVMLSGRDHVAQEFSEVLSSPKWQKLLPENSIQRHSEADHTFSTAAWREAVANSTVTWIEEFSALRH